jgi:hypothetical protein
VHEFIEGDAPKAELSAPGSIAALAPRYAVETYSGPRLSETLFAVRHGLQGHVNEDPLRNASRQGWGWPDWPCSLQPVLSRPLVTRPSPGHARAPGPLLVHIHLQA